jgi:hypothetical protein
LLLGLSVVLHVGACTSQNDSEMNGFSVIAEQNFSVEKTRTSSGVDITSEDYVISVKKDIGLPVGTRLTTANPNPLAAVTMDTSTDACNDLNFGGMVGWRLPSVAELKVLRSSRLKYVGNGDRPLFANVEKLLAIDSIVTSADYDSNCRDYRALAVAKLVGLDFSSNSELIDAPIFSQCADGPSGAKLLLEHVVVGGNFICIRNP